MIFVYSQLKMIFVYDVYINVYTYVYVYVYACFQLLIKMIVTFSKAKKHMQFLHLQILVEQFWHSGSTRAGA